MCCCCCSGAVRRRCSRRGSLSSWYLLCPSSNSHGDAERRRATPSSEYYTKRWNLQCAALPSSPTVSAGDLQRSPEDETAAKVAPRRRHKLKKTRKGKEAPREKPEVEPQPAVGARLLGSVYFLLLITSPRRERDAFTIYVPENKLHIQSLLGPTN
ncbi:uncharacterized protein V6R79_007428 [Siganus canaliculatus]